jgi:hypothetical protein
MTPLVALLNALSGLVVGANFTSLVQEKNILKVLFAFWKTLTNSKNCSGSRIKIPASASLSAIDRFSAVSTSHWMQEKSA